MGVTNCSKHCARIWVRKGWGEEIEAEYRGDAKAPCCTVARAGKRAAYIATMEELDGVISDPSGYGDLQVRAMNVLVGAIRMCYRIVVDVDVERLEVELEGLKDENRRRKEARGELGYRVEGSG